MLSGGIDSSALAALAARESSYRVSTFSIGFEERSFNELELARLVAERYGTDHHELILRPDAVELLPKLAEAFDEPFADSSALPDLPRLAARRRAREGRALGRGRRRAVRRLLHVRGRHARAAHRPARLGAAPAGRAAAELLRARSASTTRRSGSRAPRTCRRSSATTAGRRSSRPTRARALLDGRRGEVDPLDIYRARYAETEGADELARLQDVDIGIYLADDLLVKTDRASMAHSLEARVPFCDPEVAELALALPRSHEGARPREEAAAARRRRAAAAARDRARPQAGVLDPRRGLAARRAASRSRARCCRPSAAARQGFFRPEAVTRAARPPHVARQRGPQPPDLGPADVLPLARSLRCRAGNAPGRELRTA